MEPAGPVAPHDDAVVPAEQRRGRSLHDGGHHRPTHRVQARLTCPRKISKINQSINLVEISRTYSSAYYVLN